MTKIQNKVLIDKGHECQAGDLIQKCFVHEHCREKGGTMSHSMSHSQSSLAAASLAASFSLSYLASQLLRAHLLHICNTIMRVFYGNFDLLRFDMFPLLCSNCSLKFDFQLPITLIRHCHLNFNRKES